LGANRENSSNTSISCRLIPLSQAIGFIVLLMLLSTTSWMFGAIGGVLIAASAIFQVVLIPVLIGSAISLKIVASPHGLVAESTLHKQSLFNRNERSWDDLHSVRLRKLASPSALMERVRGRRSSQLDSPPVWERLLSSLGKGWTQQGFLILDFKSGGNMAFPLAGFSGKSLEDLFLTLSRFADPLNLNPDVIALQRDILTGQEMHLDASFTKMWEESLRQRFEVTNFVPLLGGQTLRNGELKILMLLACGGMSSVYLARNDRGDRLTVKEIAVPENADADGLRKVHEMFAREASILSKLEHPQIVRVLDHFLENERDYLVLEYVPGLTLRQQIQMHGPFGERDVVEMTVQLADILSYLHGLTPPVIHRDLTPDNLVIRNEDRKITLIDFGAANEFIGSVTGTLIGKQCYIPPEQFRGQAVPESDIYALGATLFYLLTGQDPEPITPSHPREICSEISEEIDALVAKLTSAEPADRLRSGDEIRAALGRND